MKNDIKNFLNMMGMLTMLLAILWVLFAFIIGLKMVPNDDMQPKMNAGDLILYYRIDRKQGIQDTVVVRKNDTEYVGRVIAQGGDTIEITDEENVIVNGNVITEDYIMSPTPRYEGFVEYPLKLAADECFILADKRNGGEDSRYYGPVKKSEVKGTIIGLYRRSGF